MTQKKCLSGALGGRDVCALTAVFSPCPGLFLRGCCTSSRFLSLDLQPEGGTSPDFGGYQAGTQRISRNRGLGTSILVPSLRKEKTFGLALFQSRSRLTSFNETITIACVVYLFLSTGGKNCFLLHTGLKSRDLARERSRNKSGGGTTRTAVQPGPLSHTSSALLSTCLVLENRHCPSFFGGTNGEKNFFKSIMKQTEWGGGISKTLFKRKTGLIMHMLVHIPYTARVHVCIWLDLLYPLRPRPLPRPQVLTLYPRIPLQPPRRQDHKHIRVIQNNENKYLNQKKRQQCNVNTLCSVFFLSHSYTSDIFFLILIALVQRSGLNFNKLFKEKKNKDGYRGKSTFCCI